ncbi:hypothetical protein C1H76_8723 [Elsinoe australis]|uniref:PD-(D/E)XK nuclease-like domain-containing protein n=1 Tax=Elsinoe australis TaxID=40998 RepID=A0A4U7AQA7_9PEZI|nr:hypothetical protein C1H76_8723 [Elsinoe australis]
MRVQDGVQQWLDGLSYHTDRSLDSTTLDQAIPPLDVLTPPASAKGHAHRENMQTPRKRLFPDSVDDDPTPTNARAVESLVRSDDGGSPSKRSASSRQTSSVSAGSSTHGVKKLSVIRKLASPIRYRAMHPGRSIQHSVDPLIRSLRKCAAGLETVPEIDLACARERFPDDFNLQSIVGYGLESARAELGRPLSLDVAHMISLEASRCTFVNEYEPGWNSSYHGIILATATYLSKYQGEVTAANVTTARILARYATPSVSDAHIPGRMIDFAFCLEAEEIPELRELLLSNARHGFELNHTDHAPTSQRPIAISIETKRQGVDREKGELQLEIWASAHLNRLQALVPPDLATELPVLPLVLVQGATWSVMFAQRHLTSTGQSTIVWKDIPLGDTLQPSGVFKVVSALLHLLDWARNVYTPWYIAALRHQH